MNSLYPYEVVDAKRYSLADVPNFAPYVSRQPVVIVPTNEGQNVFVSLHKKLEIKSAQGFRFKEVEMLTFSQSGELVRKTNIIKLVVPFTPYSKDYDLITRRMAIMQRVSECPFFPTTYAYVVTDSKKHVKKLSLYQERAEGDLVDINNTVQNLPTFPEDVKISLCKSVVSALHFLHSRGIVYKDLKLENILVFRVSGVWQFKLTDLGLASRADDLVARAKISGTVEYLAPEVLESFKGLRPMCQGLLSDLWGLGLIINSVVEHLFPRCVQILDERGVNFDLAEWKQAVNALPAFPQVITNLTDLRNSLLQKEPENRLSLDQVLAFLNNPTIALIPARAWSWPCSVL